LSKTIINGYCGDMDAPCTAETCPLRKKFKYAFWFDHCKHRNADYNGQLEGLARKLNDSSEDKMTQVTHVSRSQEVEG